LNVGRVAEEREAGGKAFQASILLKKKKPIKVDWLL
jgi:hypothetical protein